MYLLNGDSHLTVQHLPAGGVNETIISTLPSSSAPLNVADANETSKAK